MKFRSDINGLRAIAVAAVVLFHFEIAGLPGGFAGVDIFFVISGFLMSGIIYSKMAAGDFSIIRFYLDRCKRIMPALAVLCLVLLVGGWFFLAPQSYRNLGNYVYSSLTFFSNVVFWREGGYFELDSHQKWLLHTWSLSVEWQFYLIFPVFLVLVRRFLSLAALRWAMLVCAVGSFALSAYISIKWPSAAFYLLPTRAWEMLAGGLVFLFPRKLDGRTPAILEIVGMAIIGYSLFFLDESVVWPGWHAIIPVAGAALVIFSGRQNSVLTANPVSQFLGKISYSVYLWHWPVVIFVNYFHQIHSPLWVAAGILVALLFGYVSYRLVENNTAFKSLRGLSFSYARLAIPVVAIALLGVTVITQKGFPSRVGPAFQAATAEMYMPSVKNGWCFYSVDDMANLPVGEKGLGCQLGQKSAALKGLLFGDSFAGQYGPFWDILGKKNDFSINSVATNWCYPSVDAGFTGPTSSRAYRQCQINRKYLDDKAGSYDFVILSGSWNAVLGQKKMQGLLDEIKAVSEKTRLVIVMAAPKSFDVNVKFEFEQSFMLGHKFDVNALPSERDEVTRQANQQLAAYAAKFSNVIFIDRASMFNIHGIASDVTGKNIPYSLDGMHISLGGSKNAAESYEGSDNYINLRQRLVLLQSQHRRAAANY